MYLVYIKFRYINSSMKEIRIDEGQCWKVMSSNNESINLNVELILPNSKARIPSLKEKCF